MHSNYRKITRLLSILLITHATLLFAQTNEQASDPTQVQASKDVHEPVANLAPDLQFVDETGQVIALSSLKGKVVFINLWATWCAPCLIEMPTIYKLRQTFQDRQDLVFLMVDIEGKLEKGRKWMQKKQIDLPVYGLASQIPMTLFTGSIPTTLLIDKEGKLFGRQIGAADYMNPALVKLIGELLDGA